MSEVIKKKRIAKAKHDIIQTCFITSLIIFTMIFLFLLLTYVPHVEPSSIEIVSIPRWQYARDNFEYFFGGMAIAVFLGLLSYWSWQNEKLLKQEKEERIRELISEDLRKRKHE